MGITTVQIERDLSRPLFGLLDFNAGMVESVDSKDSKSFVERRGGSSPSTRTILEVSMTDKYQRIIEAMRRQTQERLSWPPEKLLDWIRSIHGPELRTLEGKEADHMLLVLELIGHYASTNNQRLITYFYKHAGKEYRVNHGLGDGPLVEEVLS